MTTYCYHILSWEDHFLAMAAAIIMLVYSFSASCSVKLYGRHYRSGMLCSDWQGELEGGPPWDHSDCILQSCGNEIGGHFFVKQKPQSNCYGLYPSLSLENRNTQCIFLMNVLYLPISFLGYTLSVDLTLVNLLLYGQHLPHKYRIEKLYYIYVWWNEVLPKLWCGEDLLYSLYLWELHATLRIPNWVSKHVWLKVQLYVISVTGGWVMQFLMYSFNSVRILNMFWTFKLSFKFLIE